MTNFWKDEFRKNRRYLDEEDLKEISENEKMFPEINSANSSEEINNFLDPMSRSELIQYYCDNMKVDPSTLSRACWGGKGNKNDIKWRIIQISRFYSRSTACIIRFSNPRYFRGGM